MQLNFQGATMGSCVLEKSISLSAAGNYYCILWRAVITPLKSGLSCCMRRPSANNGIKRTAAATAAAPLLITPHTPYTYLQSEHTKVGKMQNK